MPTWLDHNPLTRKIMENIRSEMKSLLGNKDIGDIGYFNREKELQAHGYNPDLPPASEVDNLIVNLPGVFEMGLSMYPNLKRFFKRRVITKILTSSTRFKVPAPESTPLEDDPDIGHKTPWRMPYDTLVIEQPYDNRENLAASVAVVWRTDKGYKSATFIRDIEFSEHNGWSLIPGVCEYSMGGGVRYIDFRGDNASQKEAYASFSSIGVSTLKFLLEQEKTIVQKNQRSETTPKVPGGHVGTTFTVLTIDLSLPQVRSNSNEPWEGSKGLRCEHERRGHWRTYKTGKRVWVKSCTINPGNNRRVDKDYLVK